MCSCAHVCVSQLGHDMKTTLLLRLFLWFFCLFLHCRADAMMPCGCGVSRCCLSHQQRSGVNLLPDYRSKESCTDWSSGFRSTTGQRFASLVCVSVCLCVSVCVCLTGHFFFSCPPARAVVVFRFDPGCILIFFCLHFT